MKLKSDSFSVFIYKFVYNTQTLPNNLCPYFWKWLLMWVLVIPYTLILGPLLIIEAITKTEVDEHPFLRIMVSAMVYLGLFVVFTYGYMNYQLFKAIFHCYSYDRSAATTAGIADLIITGFIGIGLLIKNWYNIIDFFKGTHIVHATNKPKKEYIIIEFIKAKYNKYCPPIDWE